MASVSSGWRTPRPDMRIPSKACGEVTSWTRWRSMNNRSGSPAAAWTTWRSHTFWLNVRGADMGAPLELSHDMRQTAQLMDSVSGVGVLDKAMAIVAAAQAGPISLSELVDRTSLSRPTAHRLAVALE